MKIFPRDGGFRVGWRANVDYTPKALLVPAGKGEPIYAIDPNGPLFKTEQEAKDAIAKLEAKA